MPRILFACLASLALPAAAHHGWSEYDAKGKTVTVVGYPNRDKPEEMRAERITAGSKTVELR